MVFLLVDVDCLIVVGYVYKDGGVVIVVWVEVNGCMLIIKCYNIKGWVYWLKCFWWLSWVWVFWCEGNCLEFFGIVIVCLLVMLEWCWCWLCGCVYLIIDYFGGQDIIVCFKFCLDMFDGVVLLLEVELVVLDWLFLMLICECISYGDLKGYNLFWQVYE